MMPLSGLRISWLTAPISLNADPSSSRDGEALAAGNVLVVARLGDVRAFSERKSPEKSGMNKP